MYTHLTRTPNIVVVDQRVGEREEEQQEAIVSIRVRVAPLKTQSQKFTGHLLQH